jgi:hypothetical protein
MSLLNSEKNARPDTLNTENQKQEVEDVLSDELQGGEQEEIKQDINE